MNNILCRELLGIWDAWYCHPLDIGALAFLTVTVLGALALWLMWQRWQCRKMQRIRGSQRNGPAVLTQSPKGDRWVYSSYLKWKGRVFIGPRPGYDIEDARRDLESLADALNLRGAARPVQVDHNQSWSRFLGFRFVARPDLTQKSAGELLMNKPQKARRLGFTLGTDESGAPVQLSFREGAAGAIVGGSGCGKSVLLARVASECKFKLGFKVTLIDPHEMLGLGLIPGAKVIGRSLDDWLGHYRELEAELLHRLRLLKEKNVSKWTELSVTEMPAILTCVDECHELLSPHLASDAQRATEQQKAFAELQRIVAKIASQGRKVGILQIFVGQSAYTSDWSLSFTNMTLFKAAFALPNESLSNTFIGSPLAADPSLRNGRFVFSDSRGTRIIKLQTSKK